ncbi:2-oxoacid:acceptor oxidoreductase subunit alpha [bacterium]|jgi:2-oxoglutarate/2-oxoacid ferredoxin oxidoreductase subunit alpha|nr:2-oxoacid:acceptor oxidoreductase subunit alpha [bacterium]
MSAPSAEASSSSRNEHVEERDSVIVRFAGDSGDGMQLVGGQFTNTSAMFGNDVSTFPDFPAEIRAPAGTPAGVSGFQIHFSNHDIKTPGDDLDALVAMNPAALRQNLRSLRKGGILIVNSDSFGKNDLRKANYESSPLDDDSLQQYKLVKIPMTSMTRDAVAEAGLGTRAADRCRNFFALGVLYWLYDRAPDATIDWINEKFAKVADVADANRRALKAGMFYGETAELLQGRYRIRPATDIQPGTYRQIMGNQALAYGLITAARLAGKDLFYASYPITPASDILHELAKLKNFGVRTFQAEDEIAAVGSAIGASFGGAFAATGTSGPGVALKSEAIGLAVMTELPLVIINVQRGGPSTGLPTKTEQADLLQVMFGRNGESPVPVVAAAYPSDCFTMIQEAFRIAVEYMTPVFFLSDAYIANGAEPWKVPSFENLSKIEVKHPTARVDDGTSGDGFLPYTRNEKNARPWAIPGTAGFEHRIGGLEKENNTGNVSYDPANHERMVRLRQAKVDGIADSIPLQTVDGPASGDLLMVSWGGTYGAVSTAAAEARREGLSVAHAHLRYLNPFPKNLEAILKSYKKVLVCELNLGQLWLLLRGKYLVPAEKYNKVQGQPFLVTELTEEIHRILGS